LAQPDRLNPQGRSDPLGQLHQLRHLALSNLRGLLGLLSPPVQSDQLDPLLQLRHLALPNPLGQPGPSNPLGLPHRLGQELDV